MTASFYCQEVDRFQVERSIIQSASNSEITNKIKDICNDHKYLIRPTGNDNCIFGVDDGFIGCPIHYYVFWFDSINFKCKRCQNNKLSATSISSFNELCNIENTYDIAKAFDYGKDFSLKPCEYLVNNSIERLEGTPPISIYYDDCNVCQESKNKDSCGCKGNSTKVGSSCKCLENQILLNQLFCSDCENLKVPSLDKTRCVCPEGKFPNQDKECKSCPKGSFSNTTDSKSCTECRFLKTTQGSNSKSIKDFSLIIASIWIIWINSRKKNSSINQINNHNVNSRGSDRRVSKNYEHMVQNNAEISVPVNQKILELKGDYQYAKMDHSNSQDCSGNQYCSQVTIPYEDRK
ncbi:MAG: hypothetical protein MHPSP_002816 [Paramarteilia canceri]